LNDKRYFSEKDYWEALSKQKAKKSGSNK